MTVLVRNPRTPVPDRHPHNRPGGGRADLYRTACLRVLGGVLQEIDQDREEARNVYPHRWKIFRNVENHIVFTQER